MSAEAVHKVNRPPKVGVGASITVEEFNHLKAICEGEAITITLAIRRLIQKDMASKNRGRA